MAYKERGQDIVNIFVNKEYIIDAYPNLINGVKSPECWTWGDNIDGQLGDGTTTDKSSPVQTSVGGTNWKQVSTGSLTSGAIKTDGTLWLWGRNNYGQLGDGTRTGKSSPVQIGNSTEWRQISITIAANDYFGAGIMKNQSGESTLWTWGRNNKGQLGDGTTTDKSSPVQTIAGGTNWKQVSCGGKSAAAIKTDGTLWTWGDNNIGQLGDGTVIERNSPVQTVAGGTNWKQVSCGNDHTAAIKTDGTLWTWGDNASGRLGDGTRTSKSSPVQTIAGGTNWKRVSCGDGHTAAIKTDGTLWLWGNNASGRLGDGTSTDKSSPVQTIAGGTNWKQVSCGNRYTAAIKTDGTLWTWGENNIGQLGDGTVINKNSPVQTVAGGTNWKQVSCGDDHTAAIKDTDINF